MFVNGGLVGPKSRPNGVDDGQPVNIPAPSCFRYHDGVTEFDKLSVRMVGRVSRKPSSGRQIRREVKVSGDANPASGGEVSCVKLPRKTSKEKT
jgi:hypothetical protein